MARPTPGDVQRLAPGLRRILADNPSPMTHWGTNTYLVGETEVAVIDPGPDDPAHVGAILAAAGDRITTILLTHAHLDHTAGVRALQVRTGAEVIAFGRAGSARSARMEALAAAGVAGGEGVDSIFAPDRTVSDGDILSGADWRLEVVHTPGHMAEHISFEGDFGLVSGDHVMDWASTLVSPPDGDVRAFMETCDRLIDRRPMRLHPAHGGTIEDGIARLEWLMAHRRDRENAILDALGRTPLSLRDLTARVYTDIPPAMLPAAERNVLAHLIDLVERKHVVGDVLSGPEARFAIAP